jgi:hypothetical protein
MRMEKFKNRYKPPVSLSHVFVERHVRVGVYRGECMYVSVDEFVFWASFYNHIFLNFVWIIGTTLFQAMYKCIIEQNFFMSAQNIVVFIGRMPSQKRFIFVQMIKQINDLPKRYKLIIKVQP